MGNECCAERRDGFDPIVQPEAAARLLIVRTHGEMISDTSEAMRSFADHVRRATTHNAEIACYESSMLSATEGCVMLGSRWRSMKALRASDSHERLLFKHVLNKCHEPGDVPVHHNHKGKPGHKIHDYSHVEFIGNVVWQTDGQTEAKDGPLPCMAIVASLKPAGVGQLLEQIESAEFAGMVKTDPALKRLVDGELILAHRVEASMFGSPAPNQARSTAILQFLFTSNNESSSSWLSSWRSQSSTQDMEQVIAEKLLVKLYSCFTTEPETIIGEFGWVKHHRDGEEPPTSMPTRLDPAVEKLVQQQKQLTNDAIRTGGIGYDTRSAEVKTHKNDVLFNYYQRHSSNGVQRSSVLSDSMRHSLPHQVHSLTGSSNSSLDDQ